jgi:hypothetical protein
MLLSVGCATITVAHDYDAEADFTNLRTYNWVETPIEAAADQLIVKRAKKAVREGLSEKGVKIAESNPDFLIAVHIVRRIKKEVVYWEHPHLGYSRYWHGPITSVYEYEMGTLALDFLSSETKELIWRGSAASVTNPNLSPEKRSERINEAVAKMLENFPPDPSK